MVTATKWTVDGSVRDEMPNFVTRYVDTEAEAKTAAEELKADGFRDVSIAAPTR